MLALKSIFAEVRRAILVFDRGRSQPLGGLAASAVTDRLRAIARGRQVISVTHAPILAWAAHTHWHLSKQVEGKRTRTQGRMPERRAARREVTRMLDGRGESQHQPDACAGAHQELQAHAALKPGGLAMPSRPRRKSEEEAPAIHPRNTLNTLSGREWIRFTKSWVKCDGKRWEFTDDILMYRPRATTGAGREVHQLFHPAGNLVLDPFAGCGSTLDSVRAHGQHGHRRGARRNGRCLPPPHSGAAGAGTSAPTRGARRRPGDR